MWEQGYQDGKQMAGAFQLLRSPGTDVHEQ
jgi:hypothetical protein